MCCGRRHCGEGGKLWWEVQALQGVQVGGEQVVRVTGDRRGGSQATCLPQSGPHSWPPPLLLFVLLLWEGGGGGRG